MSLLISSGRVHITPQRPVPLAGFAERHGFSVGVHDELEINLIALRQDEKTVLIYSVDALFVPEDFSTMIIERYGHTYNVEEKDVWMAASHTHFAPSLDKEKPGLGAFDASYYKDVTDKLIQLTDRVLQHNFIPVNIEYGKCQSKLNVNRRKKLFRPKRDGWGIRRKVLLYPDYDGVKDDELHLVNFIDESGKSVAILWNYACHPVGFPQRNEISAEFPGLIRTELRDQFSMSHLPVTFMIGFAGNIKPDITAVTHTRLLDKLRYILQLGPKYSKFPSVATYLQWVQKLSAEVKQAISNTTKTEHIELSATQQNIPLDEVIGDDASKTIKLKKLVLGNQLQIVGLSAEVFAEYKKILQPLCAANTMYAGCLADTRLYLPADKNIPEGGYEVVHFQQRFGIRGHFKKGLNEKIKSAVSKL